MQGGPFSAVGFIRLGIGRTSNSDSLKVAGSLGICPLLPLGRPDGNDFRHIIGQALWLTNIETLNEPAWCDRGRSPDD